jgi:hypothetical protein
MSKEMNDEQHANPVLAPATTGSAKNQHSMRCTCMRCASKQVGNHATYRFFDMARLASVDAAKDKNPRD